ncbi:MAG: 2Fe-2S iron-sulfur cluster-binding protein [Bacillota bacterium]
MSKVSLTIDGKNVKVPADYSVLEAAKEVGIDVPALCYDPNLESVGACRLCVVEIEGNDGLQTSCTTDVADGMVVHTESERVVKARKNLLRLLLDNHVNDCLTCDQAGECLLQDYAYRYDVKFREHDGARRERLVDTSSPYILRDEAKCILCGKCVRTCSEVADREVLTFANRGFNTRISADADMLLEESSCVSCNRCVAVCPTGALINKRNVDRGRNWNVKKETVKCNVCEYGCYFDLIMKDGDVIGVEAQEPGEGRPLCLKGRLWLEFKFIDDIEDAYLRKDDEFVKVDWKEALGLEGIMDKLIALDE